MSSSVELVVNDKTYKMTVDGDHLVVERDGSQLGYIFVGELTPIIDNIIHPDPEPEGPTDGSTSQPAS